MKTKTQETSIVNINSQTKLAPWAGAMYLLIAVVGGFSIGYVPAQIFVEADAAQTYNKLLAHAPLLRWGIAGDLLVLVLETVLSVILYRLFKKVEPTLATVVLVSRLAMAIVMGMNVMVYMGPALMALDPDQQIGTAEQVYLFFRLHKFGELIWQLFFAIHLFTLGYLLYRSGWASKTMGILMTLGAIGYLGDSLRQLLFMPSQSLGYVFGGLLVLAVIAEFWFAFWLLFKGSKKWAELD